MYMYHRWGVLHQQQVKTTSSCSTTVLKAAQRSKRPSKPTRRCISAPRAYLDPENKKSWLDLDIKHVVEAQQFDRESLDVIFAEAQKMEQVKPGTPQAKLLDGRLMATLFYEPSTRTRLSFESAMSRLGGSVLSTESAGEYSSAAKGETLEGESSMSHAALHQQCNPGSPGSNVLIHAKLPAVALLLQHARPA